MKAVKKLLCLLLAMAMVLSLSVAAFAAGGTPTPHEMEGPENHGTAANDNGKITVQNAARGEEYKIYQIFYLESYTNANTNPPPAGTDIPKDELGNVTGGHYVYKINSTWTDFASTRAADYLTIDTATGIVTWEGDTSEARVNQFAKLAMDYAKQHNIAPIQTGTGPSVQDKNPDGSLKVDANGQPVYKNEAPLDFTGLKLGYYLVDSSLGVLCSLDTTNPTVTIREKNKAPTNVKTVQEGSGWGSSNDAKIGDTVHFTSEISLSYGIERFVFHDEMSDGLTFNPNSVAIGLRPKEGNTAVVNQQPVLGSEYTVETATASTLGDSCTFHITFTDAFYALLTSGDYTLTVTYSAVLNENAEAGSAGNGNTSKVVYGDKGHTTPDSTTVTYTWDIPVFKYTLTGTDETALAGAIFKLSTVQNDTPAQGGNPAVPAPPIELIDVGMKDFVVGTDPVTGAEKTEQWHCYRAATPAEIADKKTDANPGGMDILTEITTGDDGKFRIQGLDSGTYYLHEVKAPDGFNKLGASVPIEIEAGGALKQGDPLTAVPLVKVQNGTGTELPSTGGIGTTVFYVVGSILLVGAGVLLITKKRMAAGE